MLLPAAVASVRSRSVSLSADAISMRASAVRGFGLLLNVAKRNAAASIAATAALSAASAVPSCAPLLPQQQRSRLALHGDARELARRLQALEGARLAGAQATISRVSARAPTRRWKQSPSFCTLARVQVAQHAAVRQAPPNRGRWASSGRNTMAAE